MKRTHVIKPTELRRLVHRFLRAYPDTPFEKIGEKLNALDRRHAKNKRARASRKRNRR